MVGFQDIVAHQSYSSCINDVPTGDQIAGNLAENGL